MLRSYLRLLLFACGLLAGVQIPGLIDQYGKRVDAHLREAQTAIAGFRATAADHFGGDLQALISHYQQSDDPVFQSDARSLQTLVSRLSLLEREAALLTRPGWYVAGHLLLAADPALRAETLAQYSYTVPLTPAAIGWGLTLALLLAWLVELPLALLLWLVVRNRQPTYGRRFS